MNARKQLVALAVAVVLGTAPLANLAHAADAPSSGTAATNPIIRTSTEAAQAVQDIHAARLAIFDGMSDQATRLVKDAVGKLGDAQSALASQAMPASGADGSGTTRQGGDLNGYLPFDTSIALMEGFTPGTQHRQALEQAGKQVQQGDQKGAADSLTLADIEVSVSAAMLPAKSSLDQLEQADELIGQQKWQEANLALKSVEDSIVVRSWDYDAVPQQGTQEDSGQQQGSMDGSDGDGQAPGAQNG